MPFDPFAVQSDPLSLERLSAWVESQGQARGEGCGAITSFVGIVRATHKGRQVRYLEYEAHAALALSTFARIAAEAREAWPDAVMAIHHRTGRIEVGEASVAIAAAAAHRGEAFQVCRYVIERVKQISPVWKHEFFEDGEAWVEGPVADPFDEGKRQEALGRACA
jgi:molybdopterin synthase catalytic subunit